MPFIRSFSIDTDKKSPFPFNVPAVKYAKEVTINDKTTILVGENGSGKSTLLESIAYKCNLPLISGFIETNAKTGFEAAIAIQPFLKIIFAREYIKGFFFRTEDFSDFINGLERELNKTEQDLIDLKGNVEDSIIRQMSESNSYRLREMRKKYGDNMQSYSHGEAYLKILQTRISDRGLYILDEPEAALSPLKQISLIFLIKQIVSGRNAQFIIATHSPILMGIPDATIMEIQEGGMHIVDYTETDHYKITKAFLNNPNQYLRHL
jgi:predicted ATPase